MIKYKQLVIVLAIMLGLTSCGIREVEQTKIQDNTIYRWGQMEAEYQEDSSAEPAIIGEHFVISADELNFLIEKQSLIDPDAAQAVAEETLIEEYTLYYQAWLEDVVVSDEYVDDLIQENMRLCAEVSSEDYDAFLEGIGMTNEEYWLSQAEKLKITESIAAWKELQYNTFITDISEARRISSPEEHDTLWETYYEELIAELIEQEHIQYAEIN